eukprot:snap_masked-scaffold_6-processed-gene-14.3-mRNA-1 protein AED:1.00 eAED:1.00 QI:0/-1/0/0/-1/1/1/0/249
MELLALSLRYSTWTMRAWLALDKTGADFTTRVVQLENKKRDSNPTKIVRSPEDEIEHRRALGSPNGTFPVLKLNLSGEEIKLSETLAICETVAELYPDAKLWPADPKLKALARSACAEMSSGLFNIRGQMSGHVFARAPNFYSSDLCKPETKREVERVFNLWKDLLAQSKGPFLCGEFGIVDCFYFPVITRFDTYGVPFPEEVKGYVEAVKKFPSVVKLYERMKTEGEIEIYDDYIQELGGDPFAIKAA